MVHSGTVEDASGSVVDCCRAMAERFRQGGRLLLIGSGPAAADAQHLAGDFAHPAVVGKRCLPGVCLTADHSADDDSLAAQVRAVGESLDLVVGLERGRVDHGVRRALGEARARGMLTVLLTDGDSAESGSRLAGLAEHVVRAATDDPLVDDDEHATTYQMLWELVHVFLEHPAVLVP